MRKLAFLRFFVLSIALFAVGGCQKSSSIAPKAKASADLSQKFLHVSFQSDVRSLHPRIGMDYPSAFAVKMLFEGLTVISQDGKAHPAIAKSYEISEDQKTYVFHLRDCKWTNGEEITAYDFEYAWKKSIDPSGETLGVHNFYPIENVRKIVQKKKPLDSAGIQALDEKTIKICLEYPTPYFLEMLATPSFFPVNARVEKENPSWANQERDAFVCNGPFQLKKHRMEDTIIVEKNPDYWDAESVKLPGIQIVIIKDATTQLSMFEKNQLEWLGKPLSKIPLEAMSHLRKQGKVEFFETLGLYWFFVNVESFPFQNKKIRQAFSLAINRKDITENLLQGEESPALGILPHTLATQETPFIQDNNKMRALELFHEGLEELGLEKEELPEIVVNFASVSVHQKVAEALQQQWNSVFGLNIRLEQQDWKSHYGKLQQGNFQLGGMAWQSWLRDPIYIMQTFRYKLDGVNMSRWENKDYKALLSATEEEINPIVRRELFNQAEAILMDETPVIPIYFTTIAYSKNEHLKNVYISELYEVDFRWSYFE